MASTGPSNSINDKAAEWAVEAAHGEMTQQSRLELYAWLAADRRHRGAYARARALLRATEDAVVEAYSASTHAEPASSPVSDNDNGMGRLPEKAAGSRSGISHWSARALAGGVALAASVATVLAVVGVELPQPFGWAEPGLAEEMVRLKDGSVATLDDDAEIRVALSDSIRRITLLRGEATFEVASDKARPFVVRSGDVYAQATGTVYSVSRVGLTGGTVKVKEGSVLVWPRDQRDQAVLLHAGGTVTLDPGPLATTSEPTAIAPARLPPPELAQISLDNVPIGAAVARFNRVNSTKIVIADPRIGNVAIIGLYRANDPEQFARAAAEISGGYIEHEDGSIVIKMK